MKAPTSAAPDNSQRGSAELRSRREPHRKSHQVFSGPGLPCKLAHSEEGDGLSVILDAELLYHRRFMSLYTLVQGGFDSLLEWSCELGKSKLDPNFKDPV